MAKYGDIHHAGEAELKYNFDYADTDLLMKQFEYAEKSEEAHFGLVPPS